MKRVPVIGFLLVFIALFTAAFSTYRDSASQASLTGAWRMTNGTVEEVLIFQDGYVSHTTFDQQNRKFIQTRGGTYTYDGSRLKPKVEFSTDSREEIGQTLDFEASLSGDDLAIGGSGGPVFKRIDNGTGALAGNWRITGRMNNGQLQQMQRGARKTLKLLSGTRFQWMAINPETKEFFGTGGGTYTFKDGKYTEHIEFFSRDSSRVGASLSFDGSVNGKVWTHKGLSSRGEPIHEEWSRE